VEGHGNWLNLKYRSIWALALETEGDYEIPDLGSRFLARDFKPEPTNYNTEQ
jgi:hypothetical protein